MCEKAVEEYPYSSQYVFGQYITQEMWKRGAKKIYNYFNIFLVSIRSNRCMKSQRYFPDRYEIQETFKRTVEIDLLVLIFFPDGFVTSKISKLLDNKDLDNEEINELVNW